MAEITQSKGSNSEQDRTLAANALDEFNSTNYTTCLQHLNKLEGSVGVNPKLSHNKAVAEFCKSEFKNVEEFDRTLDQILGKIVEVDPLIIEDLNLSVAYFNKAMVLFHQRKLQESLKILTALIKHIDLLDEIVAQRVGLLAIEILLNTNQPRKAEAIVDLLEKRSGHELGTSDEDETSDSLSTELVKEKPVKSLEQFKWMFRLYKMRSNLFSGKVFMIPNEDTSEISTLKGHQFYIRNDYQMAAKELSKKFINNLSTIQKNGEDHNTVIANNMGLIHFHVRHYAMAVRFFQHALSFDQAATESCDQSKPIHCVAATKRPEILYNLGIAMLHLQRPKEAFECLLVPLNFYHNNPRIWLRLAEACIMVHKHSLKEKENKNIVSSVIGSGIHRKYIIQPTPPKYVSDESQSFAIPSPNLEFASLCLRNALTLVEFYGEEFAANNKNDVPSNNTVDWTQIDEKSQCNPSKPLTESTFDKLRCAVLTAYSYVQICLGEYVLALKYAKELLESKYLPDAYAMLGRMYCAESLIMLDRVPEARSYLEPKFIAELTEEDFRHRGSPDWNINTLDAAQSILKYNLAVTLIHLGDVESAKVVMATCKHPIVFPNIKLLKMYIELQAGNIENCRILVRYDTPQYN